MGMRTDADEAGLDATYRRHADGLKRVAFLLTGSDAVAEDVVQDVFVRCGPRLASVDRPLGYLRTAVVNECRSRFRRDERERASLERVAPVELPHTVIETLDALDRLDGRKRAAIVLRYFVDIPDDDIAAILDCRPSTVRSLVRRALIDLREELA